MNRNEELEEGLMDGVSLTGASAPGIELILLPSRLIAATMEGAMRCVAPWFGIPPMLMQRDDTRPE